MKKFLWLALYIVSWLFAAVTTIAGVAAVLLEQDAIISHSPLRLQFLAALAMIAYLQLIIVGIMYNIGVLLKMWGSIQDGQNPITVGKAIGFLFIPFFNIYWIFQAWGGYPREYNNYLERNRLSAPRLQSKAYVAFSIVLLAAAVLMIPFLLVPIFFTVVIARTADAINNLNIARQFATQGTTPPPGSYKEFGGSRATILAAIVAILVYGGIFLAAGLVWWNIFPSPRTDEIPQTVGSFKLIDYSRRAEGTVFGVRSTFGGTYESPGGGAGNKTIYYSLHRFATEGFAKDLVGLNAFMIDDCKDDKSARKAAVKDNSGAEIGYFEICGDGFILKNGRYIFRVAKSSSGGTVIEQDLIDFAKAHPLNKDIVIGDLTGSPSPAANDTQSTPASTSSPAPSSGPPGTADFTLSADDYHKETQGAARESGLKKYGGKAIELTGRTYIVSKFSDYAIASLHANGDTLMVKSAKSDLAKFSELKEDTRVRVRCTVSNSYRADPENCVLVEELGIIRAGDAADQTYTAKQYWDLVENTALSVNTRIENQKKLRGKSVSVTGKIKTIGGKAHYLTATEDSWVTCQPDSDNESQFAGLKDGDEVVLIGVVGVTSTIKHCTLVSR